MDCSVLSFVRCFLKRIKCFIQANSFSRTLIGCAFLATTDVDSHIVPLDVFGSVLEYNNDISCSI